LRGSTLDFESKNAGSIPAILMCL